MNHPRGRALSLVLSRSAGLSCRCLPVSLREDEPQPNHLTEPLNEQQQPILKSQQQHQIPLGLRIDSNQHLYRSDRSEQQSNRQLRQVESTSPIDPHQEGTEYYVSEEHSTEQSRPTQHHVPFVLPIDSNQQLLRSDRSDRSEQQSNRQLRRVESTSPIDPHEHGTEYYASEEHSTEQYPPKQYQIPLGLRIDSNQHLYRSDRSEQHSMQQSHRQLRQAKSISPTDPHVQGTDYYESKEHSTEQYRPTQHRIPLVLPIDSNQQLIPSDRSEQQSNRQLHQVESTSPIDPHQEGTEYYELAEYSMEQSRPTQHQVPIVLPIDSNRQLVRSDGSEQQSGQQLHQDKSISPTDPNGQGTEYYLSKEDSMQQSRPEQHQVPLVLPIDSNQQLLRSDRFEQQSNRQLHQDKSISPTDPYGQGTEYYRSEEHSMQQSRPEQHQDLLILPCDRHKEITEYYQSEEHPIKECDLREQGELIRTINASALSFEVYDSQEQVLCLTNEQGQVQEDYAVIQSTRRSTIHKHLSRQEIEKEISTMITNIWAFIKDDDNETLFVADGYCHLDILFEKLNRPNQTISEYVYYNRQLYSYGIDMKYVIQVYSTPHHLSTENWRKYSGYLTHDIVYGCCGIHPMFSDIYDLTMELQLRTALSNKHIIGVGEIGIDLTSPGLPSIQHQKEAFLNQLHLAKELQLPVMIISRNSFIETIDALRTVLDSEYYINWRNFEYGKVELNMLRSKFSNVYFSCSPYHITNRELQKVIQQIDITRIIPESVAPHLQIPECPNTWESHPIFVGRVYQLIGELFNAPLRQVSQQLLKNIEYFYQLQ